MQFLNLLLVLPFLACVQVLQVEGEVEAKDPVELEEVPNDESFLHIALYQLRDDLDHKLSEVFPELNTSMAALSGNLDTCYDQTVGNETVNIFTEEMATVAFKFFKVNGHILENLSLPQTKERIWIFINNLPDFVRLLGKCAQEKGQGKQTMTFGLTPWTAYSNEEFEQQGLAASPPRANVTAKALDRPADLLRACTLAPLPDDPPTIPASFSWKDHGAVSPVYNQHRCGSCYIFGAVSAFESQILLNSKGYIQLSMQQLLNCQSGGCHEGFVEDMLKLFMSPGAPIEDGTVPYTSKKGVCTVTQSKLIKADGYCDIHGLESERDMQRLLLRNGPAVVSIASQSREFRHLKKAIFSGACHKEPNHVALLTGWKTLNGVKVWEIKNSWGPNWGWNGYLYLPRGAKAKKCGLWESMSMPLIAAN